MDVPTQWIGVGVVCMVGLGILPGVTSTKRRYPSQRLDKCVANRFRASASSFVFDNCGV
jgi:hypothetical protein